jgi:hypothetical protein
VAFGDHSRTWRYQNQRGNLVAVLSFDYPFPSWHDLRSCYTMTGWTLAETEHFTHPLDGNSNNLACVWAHLTRPVEQDAYLWFGEFDLNGNPIEAELALSAQHRWQERLKSFKARWDSFTGKNPDPETRAHNVLQVQIFAETVGPFTQSERTEVQTFFTAALDKLRSQCREVMREAANAGR